MSSQQCDTDIEKHFPEPVILNPNTITITLLRIRWYHGKRSLEIDLIYPDGMKQSVSRRLPTEGDPWVGEICTMEYKLAFEKAIRMWWAESGCGNIEEAPLMARTWNHVSY